MKRSNRDRVVDILEGIERIQSPSGFTDEVISHVAGIARKAGIKTRLTNKGGLLVGNHPEPTLVVAGHLDTLGAMVSKISGDGTLCFTRLGGPVLAAFEGNYVTVVSSQGKRFSGTLLLNNPAAHVNKDASTAERKPESMHIRLDCEVASKKDTQALGIGIGDFICFDPRFEFTPTGFVKSHFLDDKAGSATMIDSFLVLGKNRLEKIPVAFYFTTFEEVGHGACSGIPQTAREMLVVDMGVVGTDVVGDEYSVSICAKDSSGPYDLEFRNRLVDLARSKEIPYKVDVFPFYGSDGSAALRAGYDLRVGLIGPGVSASHGVERTHLKGLKATRDLVVAYINAHCRG